MANSIIQKNRTNQKNSTSVKKSSMKPSEIFRRGYNFAVYLEGKMIPFQSVSGLSMEMETEIIQEGGQNRMVYSLNKPSGSEKVLTLSRGLLTDEMEFTLYEPGYQFCKEIAVYVLGGDGAPVKSYYMRGCTVKKISVAEMNASSSQIVIGTMEIVYRTLEEDGSTSNSAWWRP
ncbi:MAG: phage tail protein [Clostridiales bacterium]|nr:phage tail protein [Clostridiales bacterium]